MRWLLTLSIALLLSLVGDVTLAQDPAVAFQRVLERAQPRSFVVHLRETGDASESPAMTAHYQEGRCVIVALRDSPLVALALAGLGAEDREAMLEGMLAHEFGHCADRHREGPSAGMAGSRPTVRLVRGPHGVILKPDPQRRLWSELFADAYLAFYLARWHPVRSSRLIDRFIRFREDRAASDPDHDTGPFLRGAAFLGGGEAPLDVLAWELRSRAWERVRP